MVTYPAEWNEKTFIEFMKIKRGASPRPIESYLTSSTDGVNWIKIGDAPRYGKYIISTTEKITPKGALHSVRVYPGDFILSNSMSFGRPYILNIDGCIHDGWLRLYDFQSEATDEFLYYLLSSSYVQRQYESFAAGSGVQNLNKEVVKKVNVVLPSIPEQEEIARTLSLFDTYIDDLAELIEKKKGIRDGALEDLMSRKTRLVNLSDEWEDALLSDICKIYDGTHQTPKYTLTGVRFVSVENIADLHGSNKYISFEAYQSDFKVYPEKGDILMTRIGDIGTPNVVGTDEPLAYYVSLALFKNITVNSRFLHYYIMSSAFQKELDDRTLHHATPKKINKGEIGKCKVAYPRDKKEQEAIAEVLTAMDKEIADLETEREKMIQIREGAMDDLLTGRVRLTK